MAFLLVIYRALAYWVLFLVVFLVLLHCNIMPSPSQQLYFKWILRAGFLWNIHIFHYCVSLFDLDSSQLFLSGPIAIIHYWFDKMLFITFKFTTIVNKLKCLLKYLRKATTFFINLIFCFSVVSLCNDLVLFDISGCNRVTCAAIKTAEDSVKLRTNNKKLTMVVGGKLNSYSHSWNTLSDIYACVYDNIIMWSSCSSEHLFGKL